MFSPLALAIVNTANRPLLIRTTYDNVDEDEAIRLVYLMHASLDIVDEKIEQPTSRDNYLGVLYQCEQFKIFGLMSTTKVKILLMISQRYNFGQPRENDIRLMLKNIHKAYVDATAMNPFYKPNEPVKSKRLDTYLDTIFVAAAAASSAPADATAAAATSAYANTAATGIPPPPQQQQQPMLSQLQQTNAAMSPAQVAPATNLVQ